VREASPIHAIEILSAVIEAEVRRAAIVAAVLDQLPRLVGHEAAAEPGHLVLAAAEVFG